MVAVRTKRDLVGHVGSAAELEHFFRCGCVPEDGWRVKASGRDLLSIVAESRKETSGHRQNTAVRREQGRQLALPHHVPQFDFVPFR